MALPTFTLLDNFNRANEAPLSNGGKWAKLFGGAGSLGQLVSEAWGPKEAFATGEEDGYWTVTEILNPAVAFTIKTLPGTGERLMTLWACVTNPTTGEISGYRVRFIEPPEETGAVAGAKTKIKVERVTKNAATSILFIGEQSWAAGNKLAVQVNGGKVSVWKEAGAGWVSLGEVADGTYNKGFVGIGGRGNIGRMDNIEAAASATPHEHTLTASNGQTASLRHPEIKRTFSLVQTGSWGAKLPSLPIVESLEEPLVKMTERAWVAAFWAEQIGEMRELNKGVAGKPHPLGWGRTALSNNGIRYTGSTFRDPVVVVRITAMDLAATESKEPFVAIGICTLEKEQTGYFARIERIAAGGWTVTLEKWVNGVKTATLATTTLPSTYFANVTEVPVGFGVTLVGGVLRLWLSQVVETEPLAVVLEATDTSFTSGWSVLESRGTKTLLSQFIAGTMDGHISLTSAFSKGQLLSTTQGQGATLAPKAISRTLAAPQAQSPGFVRAISRALSSTQAQVAGAARAVTHTLSATQGAAATRASAPARVLVAAQGQSIARAGSPTRIFSSAQTQVASRAASLTRTLALAQAQAPVRLRAISRALTVGQGQSVIRGVEVAGLLLGGVTQVASKQSAISRALSTTQPQAASVVEDHLQALAAAQPQAASHTAAIPRTLAATQAQAPTRGTAVSRALSAIATSAASRLVALARTLTVGQGQAISEEGVLEPTSRDHPHTLTTAQASTIALTRALGRHLSTSAHGTPTLARSVTRLLTVGVAASATLGRQLARSLATSAHSSATLGAERARGGELTATQPQLAHLASEVPRGLSTTTSSTATLSFVTIEVPLPPRVKMSASVTALQRDSQTAAAGHTSQTAPRTLPTTLGASRLTSRVEAP